MSTARATVIIGAGYGDEGKGVLTDFFAAQHEDALVVRFNGGCQAGHTVVTPAGERHVFSHFGSGTFAGAKTFLSKFFIANPMWFSRERAVLEALGVSDDVLTPAIDFRALVTTPYDMMINQIVETARGSARHGSCGNGINETIERSLKSDTRLTVGDLVRCSERGHRTFEEAIVRLLDEIKQHWMPERLRALGVDAKNEAITAFTSLLQGTDVAERWLEDAFVFCQSVRRGEASQLSFKAADGKLIFEGAQGLSLDMDRGAFPYVTRSNTGLKNVLDIASEARLDYLDIVYAHRAYATRHGAGPFAREIPGKPYDGIEETTNVTNIYQGDFRYAYLDVDVLAEAIRNDLSDARGVRTSTTLALTCLDQVDDTVTYFANGERHAAARESLPAIAQEAVGVEHVMTSYGPTRERVSRSTARGAASKNGN